MVSSSCTGCPTQRTEKHEIRQARRACRPRAAGFLGVRPKYITVQENRDTHVTARLATAGQYFDLNRERNHARAARCRRSISCSSSAMTTHAPSDSHPHACASPQRIKLPYEDLSTHSPPWMHKNVFACLPPFRAFYTQCCRRIYTTLHSYSTERTSQLETSVPMFAAGKHAPQFDTVIKPHFYVHQTGSSSMIREHNHLPSHTEKRQISAEHGVPPGDIAREPWGQIAASNSIM